jgi:exopolysaccharide (amylovoran) exporter
MASIKHDASWTFASTLFGSLSQLLLMVMVARQFDQATLGIFALLSIAIALLGYLQDLGLSTYTVHRQDLTAADRANLHWISIALGVIAMLTCLGFAPLTGWMYQSELLRELLLWLSPQFLLLGVANQYQAELIQQGKLSLLAKIDVLSKIVGLSVSIALLLVSNPDLTALVFGQLASSLLRALLLWYSSSAPLLWLSPLNISLCQAALRFGLYQSGSQVIGFLRNRADQLIIGKLLGLEALGLYSLARDIIQHPARLLGPVIQRVLLPRFAKGTGSSQLYQQSLKFNLQINTVIYAILSLLSWPLVWFIFGEVYLPAATLICAFSLYGMIKPTGTVLSTYSQGIGRADIEFRWNLIASFWMISIITLAAVSESLLFTALMLSALQYALSCYAQHYFAKQHAAPVAIKLWRLSFPYVVITVLAAIIGMAVGMSWPNIGWSF